MLESRREWLINGILKAGKLNSNNTNFQFWQQNNKPIELWTNSVMQQKLDYIHKYPVESGFVEEPWHWKYSSAKDYSGQKGILKICKI